MSQIPSKNLLSSVVKSAQGPALFAIGSNLGEPQANVQRAIDVLAGSLGSLTGISRFYVTSPLNPPALAGKSQPNFVNAVISCACTRPVEEIFTIVKQIEADLGRARGKEIKWGPRIIDVDFLAAGNQIAGSSELTLPHPELHNRDFVLYPLRDADPRFVHPTLQLTVEQMIYNYHAAGRPNHILRAIEAGSTAHVSDTAWIDTSIATKEGSVRRALQV